MTRKESRSTVFIVIIFIFGFFWGQLFMLFSNNGVEREIYKVNIPVEDYQTISTMANCEVNYIVTRPVAQGFIDVALKNMTLKYVGFHCK